METLERILAEHPFFEGLDERHMAIVTGCASNVRFASGEYLFHEREEANRFFLIREGKVALTVPNPERDSIPIQTLGPGEVVGWSWLIPPHQWRFDARADGLVRAFALDGKCLRGKCQEDHDLGYALLMQVTTIIAQRLHHTRNELLQFYNAWSILSEDRS